MDVAAHVPAAQDHLTLVPCKGRQVRDGHHRITGASVQGGRADREAARGLERDGVLQVGGVHSEGRGGTRARYGEAVRGGRQRSHGGGICARGVEAEVGNVGAIVLEADGLRHVARDAGELRVVHLHAADARTPRVTLEVEDHADLLRGGARLEVAGVRLVAVARHGDDLLVVVVLEVVNADGAQLRAVRLDPALGQGRETVHLVGGDVHDLGDLGGGPAGVPHVAVDGEHVVVLVDLVAALLGDDLLGGVVLVIGVDRPTLDARDDTAARAVVPLALEVPVLQQVLHHVPVLHGPLGLQREVRRAERVDGDPVTVHEDAGVRGDRVTVGVVQSVRVVESAPVRGVAQLAAVPLVGAVVEPNRAGGDVPLEARPVLRHRVRVEVLPFAVRPDAELHGVAVIPGREPVELHLPIRPAGVNRRGGKVLGRKRRAFADQANIVAHITTTKNQVAFMVTQIRCICNGDFHLLGPCRDGFRVNLKTGSRLQRYVLYQIVSGNNQAFARSRTIEPQLRNRGSILATQICRRHFDGQKFAIADVGGKSRSPHAVQPK